MKMTTILALLYVLVISAVSCFSECNSTSQGHLKHNVIPKKSETDKEFIKVLSSRLLEYNRPLDFSLVPGVTGECQQSFLHYLRALKSFELWALKMYDANGKLTSGVLSGNVNTYGDFQECLSVIDDKFRGKHCFTQLQPFVTEQATYLNYLRKLAQSFDLMQSRFQDPGHVFGHFQTIIHGLCVPSTCTHTDVELAMKYYLEQFLEGTGVWFNVKVEEDMCQVEEHLKRSVLGRGEKLTICILVLIFFLVAFSTHYDKNIGKNPWLTSFSVDRNWRELTSTRRSAEDIKSIHGIRFLNALLIFLCHKSVETLIPKINRTDMALNSAKAGSIVVRMCALYTDVFLMISGTLVAYSMTKQLRKGHKVILMHEYIGRYIRVIPNIFVTMLVTAYVIPHWVEPSPLVKLVIDKPAELCVNHGWRNIFMIQNWFNFDEMCNLHTHHVGSDYELFLIAPVLLSVLWKSPRRGFYLILILGSLSTVARFYITYSKELMYFVPFGAKLSKLLETANLLYSLPTHRFSVYGIGLLLGFVLRKYNAIKLTKLQINVGKFVHVVSIIVVIASSIVMTGIDVKYNVMLHSLYAAFAPILYCLHVAWIILFSHLGHRNAFTRFLEWKGFVITTKFCYAFYLIQVPIFQLFIANIKDIRYFTPASMINLNEIVIVCAAAICLTLFVEAPFNNIKKILFKRTDENANDYFKSDEKSN